MGEQVFAIRSSTSLGNEKNLANFEFKLGQFVCPTPHFEAFSRPTNLGEVHFDLDLQEREQEERQTDPGTDLDFGWAHSHLYFLPAMTCTGHAMHSTNVKNLKSDLEARGVRA